MMKAKRPNQPGNWATLFVDPLIPWPEEEMLLTFRGHKVRMFPGEEDTYPMVAIDAASERITSDDGYRLLREFVSALVWSKGQPIRIEGSGGGTYPYRMKLPRKGKPPGSLSPLHFDYMPEPDNPKAKLGMAIYREAMEVSNVAYKFLGFAKVLNIIHAKSQKQKAWINANLDAVASLSGRERLEELRKLGEDIGRYLYESGRSAIAHAYQDPLVNPDDPEDYKRLGRDIPLIRDLAEHAIENKLGVKSTQTIWKEHLYELAGFKNLLSPELVEMVRCGNLMGHVVVTDLPRMSIRLRDLEKFDAMEELMVKPAEYLIPGTLALRCSKAGGIVQVMLYVDFSEERLRINQDGGFAVMDNGTQQAARWGADVMRFKGQYYANGELEVWDVEQDQLLGRCDAFIPVNIDPGGTAKNFEKLAERFEGIANERAKGEKDAHDEGEGLKIA